MAFTDMTGKQVPNVTFHTQQDGKWVDVTTDDLFKGKKVVLFALPGAFTTPRIVTGKQIGRAHV